MNSHFTHNQLKFLFLSNNKTKIKSHHKIYMTFAMDNNIFLNFQMCYIRKKKHVLALRKHTFLFGATTTSMLCTNVDSLCGTTAQPKLPVGHSVQLPPNIILRLFNNTFGGECYSICIYLWNLPHTDGPRIAFLVCFLHSTS